MIVYKRWLILLFIASSSIHVSILSNGSHLKKAEQQDSYKKKSKASISSHLVDFSYDQKLLKDIVNQYAQELGYNIIYPETDSLTAKITFNAGKKITLTEAWNFVLLLLDQAGFTFVAEDEYTYKLSANKNAYKEALPIYFNIDYEVLPDSADKVRYIYSCNNIQLNKQQVELNSILKNAFSENFTEQVIFDQYSNSIIFTAKSSMIKSIMPIISSLDETGFKEAVEVLKLDYTQAAEVATVLTNMMNASGQQKLTSTGGYVSLATGSKARYFSEYAAVINLDPKNVRKINSLIIMGKQEDVDIIKNFIKKYLDIPQQKGKSFFHVIELQWLNASTFVQVLQQLIQGSSSSSTGTGQSTSSFTSDLAFDPQIKIVPETVSQGATSSSSSSSSSSGNNTVQRGGNRLVIAAQARDWERLKSLIEQVDVPKKQVVVEGLVMDLNLNFVRNLGSQIRTRGLCSSIFPKYMQAQAGLTVSSIIESVTENGEIVDGTQQLTGDLSNILNPESQGLCDSTTSLEEGQTAAAAAASAGTTTFMISGGKDKTNGVWAFFQLLSTHRSAKVLTRPVVIASNNQKASLSSAVTKQLADGVGSGVSPSLSYSTDSAPVSISFTPLISENNTVNLQVQINLSSYANPTVESSGLKSQRALSTNVSMMSGDVLILGGLLKETVERSKRSVPFVDNIPVVGTLFGRRNKDTTTDQLFILIRTTVIAPRMQGGMGSITESAVNFMNSEFSQGESSFTNLQDPITRWFFTDTQQNASNQVDQKVSDLMAIDRLKEGVEIHTHKDEQNKNKTTSDENPLSTQWFSSKTHEKKDRKDRSKDMNTLEKNLQNMGNPFKFG